MVYQTLIDANMLHKHLEDLHWVVVDCRFDLMDTEAGRRGYREGHIPGARYAHLDQDLSGPPNAGTGRHPLPEPAELARTLGEWGIDGRTQVVVYDGGGGGIAARLWWLLRWLNHPAVALLDGGLRAWRAAGLPLSTELPELKPAVFSLTPPDGDGWVDTAFIEGNVASGANLLLDARAGARFRGEMEPIDPVAGHVPGAVGAPMDDNLDGDGRFLTPAALRQRFESLLAGRSPQTVIHMCGSGVTACHNLLAMEVAGLSGSRLYAGSWSEWIRDPARPVAVGGE
jgi:thiosulfate/3-mercaptopyruvate sulfurtransferase